MELSDRIQEIVDKSRTIGELYNRQLAVLERINQQAALYADRINKSKQQLDDEEKAQGVLLALEEAWRKDFERNVEEIISDGISLVFGEPLEFRLNTSIKAGASAIDFEIETADGSTPVMNAEGGSLVEVISFLLRVLIILAYKPALRKVLVADEMFGGVSEENTPTLAALLRKIVDETGIQIILATHNKALAELADIVYEVKNTGGIGRIVPLKTRNETRYVEED